MVLRQHLAGGVVSEAVYSPCERYRYTLTRVWDAAAPRVLFVMLNPSTATEVQTDPTVERCGRRARALGFGAVRVVNLFALRATDPRVMRAEADPVGPCNDVAILSGVLDWRPERVICAWGMHGQHLGRAGQVEEMLRGTGQRLWHLRLTASGQPRHPLYIGYDRQPEVWE